MEGTKLAKGLRICTVIFIVLEVIGSLVGAIALFKAGNGELIAAGLGVIVSGVFLAVFSYFLCFSIAYNTEKIDELKDRVSSPKKADTSSTVEKQNAPGEPVRSSEKAINETTDKEKKDTKHLVRISYVTNIKKKYDVRVLIDDEEIGTLKDDETLRHNVEEGKHEFRFESVEDPSISTTVEYWIERPWCFLFHTKSDRIVVDDPF